MKRRKIQIYEMKIKFLIHERNPMKETIQNERYPIVTF
jgi:hypothetical protein